MMTPSNSMGGNLSIGQQKFQSIDNSNGWPITTVNNVESARRSVDSFIRSAVSSNNAQPRPAAVNSNFSDASLDGASIGPSPPVNSNNNNTGSVGNFGNGGAGAEICCLSTSTTPHSACEDISEMMFQNCSYKQNKFIVNNLRVTKLACYSKIGFYDCIIDFFIFFCI